MVNNGHVRRGQILAGRAPIFLLVKTTEGKLRNKRCHAKHMQKMKFDRNLEGKRSGDKENSTLFSDWFGCVLVISI